MSYEDEKKIKDDLNDFFENARLIDNQLRNTNENQENEQSFSNGSKARYNQDSSSSSLADRLGAGAAVATGGPPMEPAGSKDSKLRAIGSYPLSEVNSAPPRKE
jgi:hypothetical protein